MWLHSLHFTVESHKPKDLAANPLEWMATAPPEYPKRHRKPYPDADEAIPDAVDTIDAEESSSRADALAEALPEPQHSALTEPLADEPVKTSPQLSDQGFGGASGAGSGPSHRERLSLLPMKSHRLQSPNPQLPIRPPTFHKSRKLRRALPIKRPPIRHARYPSRIGPTLTASLGHQRRKKVSSPE